MKLFDALIKAMFTCDADLLVNQRVFEFVLKELAVSISEIRKGIGIA